MPEGLILIGLGLLGALGALQTRDIARTLSFHDALGPASYPLLLSLAVLFYGGFLCWRAPRPSIKRDGPLRVGGPEAAGRFLAGAWASPAARMFAFLALYAILTAHAGYSVASLVFFAAVFRQQGYRWYPGAALGGLVSAVLFYILFQRILAISMPAPFGF